MSIFQIDRRAALSGMTAASLLALSGCGKGASATGEFIRRDGMQFIRGDDPYRFVGANAWYLAWLGSDTKYGDQGRLTRELDRLQSIGVQNIRILAGAEESPVRNSIKPGFETQDGTLNAALLEGLDVVMAELGKRGMTAVLYFTNNWEWSGGMMSRLFWETGEVTNMNDPEKPWPAFPDAGSAFYANEAATTRFYDYVRMLVTRRNSVTGTLYSEDPMLMSWQLANEPRPGVSPNVQEAILPDYYRWIDQSAALIRSLDQNHMVSLGMEGTIATNGREDIVRRAHENVDYTTAHIWPLNWGWVDGKDLAGTWEAGSAKVADYIASHIRMATEMGKPLTFEEFGFPRDGELYDPSAATTFRERYYRMIYAAAEQNVKDGGPVMGTNFWSWNGEARAQHDDFRFVDGDTQYMGDPPHEPQGWYGLFDSDAEMMKLVTDHAAAFATA
ncbi:mannanase [Altererythrobacter sp. ZODW24]|uniref:glycoside hydrolase 5 family protein n=1 Tax=Altererythrobacter sp. ZODW24 TaxID=2185142 RepID=UPI000DF78E94|nr:mannanase [Altererythrobacter sp. ZODW24]